MTDVERQVLLEEYQALRPQVEDGTRTDAEMARYRELNDLIAAMNAEASEDIPVEPGDAVAKPAAVAAKVKG